MVRRTMPTAFKVLMSVWPDSPTSRDAYWFRVRLHVHLQYPASEPDSRRHRIAVRLVPSHPLIYVVPALPVWHLHQDWRVQKMQPREECFSCVHCNHTRSTPTIRLGCSLA